MSNSQGHGRAFRFVSIAAIAFCSAAAHAQQGDAVARGRYVAQIGGCNDCHTPGYAQSGGKAAEAVWLTGDSVGFRGPWGTVYPSNLRLKLQEMSESQWLAYARRLKTRPPMPWFNLNAMSERDLRALYRYVRALGPGGAPAPDYVAPETEPRTPYIVFVPRAPGQAR
jgi:mono/diheme cytochrome c family protein